MFRSRSWFGGGWGRPKNLHSLEHLKYLYNVMARNQTVSEHNRGLLVESLRSIAEILIWGDQNDSSVFDFFLEKNMLSFFLRIMGQRSGGSSYVCVQLLQTLNILFENIRNETSLYYLLSNNHVNSIIVHKFDFSDEEVMAYYISFLKTLSLKLNAHTIHFFYNEHTNDFPLYTEAIKFFNHSESMVRIAVRTLTLNVYRVEDTSMLKFIRDRTAAPYFSNLVWFIGKHVLELDNCIRYDADHQSQNRLSDLVAEHLDHLHYLNDILCLNITDLNQVLTEHLLHKLLIPLYIYSLISINTVSYITSTAFNDLSLANIEDMAALSRMSPQRVFSLDATNYDPSHNNTNLNPRVSSIVSLFLLSQVFLIITHAPLVHSLAWIILNADASVFKYGASKILESYENQKMVDIPQQNSENDETIETESKIDVVEDNGDDKIENSLVLDDENSTKIISQNITDEEKEMLASSPELAQATTSDSIVTAVPVVPTSSDKDHFENKQKPFLETVLNALDVTENDYSALFALCLLYALANNRGISPELLAPLFGSRGGTALADRLLKIISAACLPTSKVRLVTLALSLRILQRVSSSMKPAQKQILTAAREQSTALLKNFYKSEEIFLDMFEHEYFDMSKGPLNVEWLCMDAAILLPPTGTPMTGIEFTKRLPCGEVERARRAIRVFFLVRDLSMKLNDEPETHLPLTNPQDCVQVNQKLDLNNSDLIGCTVVLKDGTKLRRFLVIDTFQLILVEPDSKKLGWGVAKLVGFLQDIEVLGDKDDSRCLHITIQRPLPSTTSNRVPLLSAKFLFDDHIRCMAAKQRLTKGRIKARQKKMQQIAKLLDIPTAGAPIISSGLLSGVQGSSSYSPGLNSLKGMNRTGARPENRALVRPGYATPRRESLPGTAYRMTRNEEVNKNGNLTPTSKLNKPGHSRSRENSTPRTRSREGSPRMPRPKSEEIPLELIKRSSNVTVQDIPILPRSHTPRYNLETLGETVSSVNSEVSEVQNSSIAEVSEETSFIAQQQSNTSTSRPGSSAGRRKGAIETV
ncbi:protein CLEC16A homolog isoform X2 [Chrysoperla carnea]|uniref:protein CLEC16A homolog isoform X2 n=1 Tax=Chrysoperla carnea TaxID=189513 RepID=UPI001D0848B1|nr:protein CLEC16A homolog isoform X2 [Chrysoperla carnea]